MQPNESFKRMPLKTTDEQNRRFVEHPNTNC